jgi:S-adenosylmethionine-diacylglycerol 3-amino-3-carboxypropyl transferase
MHTDAIHSFLSTHDVAISRFVMLDHMDWLSTVHYPVLQQEWQAIVHRALPGTRLLWRSGGLQVDYVDPIEVHVGRGRRRLGELLTYQRDLATDLHRQDRVHTYGSFYIADLAAA